MKKKLTVFGQISAVEKLLFGEFLWGIWCLVEEISERRERGVREKKERIFVGLRQEREKDRIAFE